MIKQLLFQISVFLALYLVCFHLHDFILKSSEIEIPFSLEKVYLFHVGFSLLICINFSVFSTVDKIFEQLGFIYLVSIFLKLIFFTIFFYNPIFTSETLSFSSKVSLCIPMIIFLLTEAFFVAKILNKKV
jgi:hypothetical protein